jgi:hypothetical protein
LLIYIYFLRQQLFLYLLEIDTKIYLSCVRRGERESSEYYRRLWFSAVVGRGGLRRGDWLKMANILSIAIKY